MRARRRVFAAGKKVKQLRNVPLDVAAVEADYTRAYISLDMALTALIDRQQRLMQSMGDGEQMHEALRRREQRIAEREEVVIGKRRGWLEVL